MKKLIILLLISPIFLYSQVTREIQVRTITPVDFYLSLIGHIDNLEKNSSLRSKSTVRNFSKLFSKNALIFNDIVPSQNFGKQVNILDYINISKTLKRKRLSSLITITQLNTDVSSLTTFSIGDKGSVIANVSIDKFMSFKENSTNLVSNDGVILDFLEWPFKDNAIIELSYEIIIPKSDSTKQEIIWKIDEILSLKKTHTRPTFYIPKTKMFLTEGSLKIDADSITVNNQSLFLQGDNVRYFTYPTKIQKNTPIYIKNISETFKFKNVEKSKINDFTNSLIFRQTQPTFLSFNAHLSEVISTRGNSLSAINNELSSSFSFSLTWLPFHVNAGKSIFLNRLDEKINNFFKNKKALGKIKKATNLKFSLGIDVSSYQSNVSTKSGNELFQNIIENTLDIDGNSYTRVSTISNINEISELKLLQIGIAANASIDFNQININKGETNTWSIQVLGKILSGFNGNITSSRSANVNYSGIYEDYNLVIGDDEQFERYDLGDYSLQSNSDIELNTPLFINLGVRVERIMNLEKVKEIGFFGGLSTTFTSGDFSAVNQQNYISTNSDELNSTFEVIEGFKLNSPLILSFGISKKL